MSLNRRSFFKRISLVAPVAAMASIATVEVVKQQDDSALLALAKKVEDGGTLSSFEAESVVVMLTHASLTNMWYAARILYKHKPVYIALEEPRFIELKERFTERLQEARLKYG